MKFFNLLENNKGLIKFRINVFPVSIKVDVICILLWILGTDFSLKRNKI